MIRKLIEWKKQIDHEVAESVASHWTRMAVQTDSAQRAILYRQYAREALEDV